MRNTVALLDARHHPRFFFRFRSRAVLEAVVLLEQQYLGGGLPEVFANALARAYA
jgi:hypothetical protein